jgi:hypothetical protein
MYKGHHLLTVRQVGVVIPHQMHRQELDLVPVWNQTIGELLALARVNGKHLKKKVFMLITLSLLIDGVQRSGPKLDVAAIVQRSILHPV